MLTACNSEPETLPVIRLGHAPHDHHAALYIAAQLPSYFQQQGGLYLKEIKFKKHYQLIDQGRKIADVMVHSSTGGGQLIRKLHENQLNVAFGGVPAIIQQIDGGSRMKIIAPVMSEGAALVMKNDFPASDWPTFIAAVKQRKQPLRIGYKIETSVQNLIFEQALQAEGISFSHSQDKTDVQVIVRNLYGAHNLIPALKNDLIDGFVVMQPFPALAEYQQQGKMISLLRDLPPAQQWLDHPCCAIAANDLMLHQHPDVLIKLVTLMLRANIYLQENPRKSASLVANWLGNPFAVEKLSLPTIKYLVDYSANWHQGVAFWISAMKEQSRLQGILKTGLQEKATEALLYDMSIFDRARAQVGQP